MSDEKQSYMTLQPQQMTVNPMFAGGGGGGVSVTAAGTASPRILDDSQRANRRTHSFHTMGGRPSSTTPGGRRSNGTNGIELTSSPRHRGAAAPLSLQPQSQASPRVGEQTDRAPSAMEMLSEDEEEQMKMEAQIGMLLTAASKNNTKRMRGLLNAGVPPSSCDYDQRTGLHLACSEGHMEAAQMLIEEGADPNAKDRFGSTPLDDAMRDGANHELVAYLRSKKARHGGLDRLQAKLIEHCAKNEVAAVRMLLTKDIDGLDVPGSAGIDPNCCDYDKRTPLHLAVAEGHAELVALLLANGADPNAMDRWGLTPLTEADRKAARVGVDPIKELFRLGGHIPEEEESPLSFFSMFFGFWELAMMICIGLFCTYGHGSAGGQKEEDARRAGGLAPISSEEYANPLSEAAAEFGRVYPLYQDVHVMIFVGFGFLMVFLRKHGYTSVGMTFLIGAFVIQWYQLVNGFWEDAFSGVWTKIPLSVETLVRGDFAAGAVLITFGVLLGKVNPQQILFIAIIETIFFGLNEHIGLRMGVADIGGTMTIHMFGAFFGYGCTWMMTPKAAHGHENNCGNYHSDIMAMVGTLFLWMFWPSFNGALSVGAAQERCIINTVMAQCGSCVVAFLASHLFRRERRFSMVDIQNATLAGGVAMGAAAEMLVGPGAAVGIGACAGLVSVLGYVYVQPFLESRLGMHDTCGVNNLHGMPSIIGGFASVIAASYASLEGFKGDEGYSEAGMAWTFPKRAVDPLTGLEGRSAHTQAVIQFAYMMTSLFIALVSGSIAGHFATLRAFTPTEVKSMYVDQEYWEVPQFETPYYFDHRGEVKRTTDPTTVAAPAHLAESGMVEDLDEMAMSSEGQQQQQEGRIPSDEGAANLDAPDNARLLGLITALETRLNALTRRVGGQVTGTPLTGPAAIPQQHHTKSAAPSSAAASSAVPPPDYPASKLAYSPHLGPSSSASSSAPGSSSNTVYVVPAPAPAVAMELTSVQTDPPMPASPLVFVPQ